MGEMKVSSSTVGDISNTITNYSVETRSTDAGHDQKETTWMNTNASKYLGYYKSIPELRACIDAKATWTIGKGFKADPETTFILDTIKGFGKDTFNTILENLARNKEIYGDAFAEIIRNNDGEIINLKPLDPAVMVIVVDRQGLIKRYEQNSKQKGTNPQKFSPEKILHLPRNRVADEIHGVSMIEALEFIILAKNEAMEDFKTVMHRFVTPRWIIKMDTDSKTKIAAEKAKWDKANANGENMYIPMGTVEVEQMAISPNSTLNPMAWIDSLDNKFYESAGVPKIILGGSGEFTEASAKIAYLAFQQTIEEEQLFIEEQIGLQMGMEINLEFPASLENELLSDKKKDGDMSTQPNETTAGSGQ